MTNTGIAERSVSGQKSDHPDIITEHERLLVAFTAMQRELTWKSQENVKLSAELERVQKDRDTVSLRLLDAAQDAVWCLAQQEKIQRLLDQSRALESVAHDQKDAIQQQQEELDRLRIELDESHALLQAVLRDKAALSAHLEAITHSRSWRITAPLRRAKRWSPSNK